MLIAFLAVTGCRGDVSSFSADDRDERFEEAALRLTFNDGDERTPSWSANGDSIYYSAEGFEEFSGQPGVLVRISRARSAATPVLRNVQRPGGVQRWLIAPTVAGSRLAYVEIGRFWPSDPPSCPQVVPECDVVLSDLTLPPLRQVVLRVRELDAVGPLEEDPALTVEFEGVTLDLISFPRNLTVRDHPYQRLFAEERASVFRTSWDPDGQRLVFSDGLRLRIWAVGAQAAEPIPGSDDAVDAAWSPAGQWIAFSRLERADSTRATCLYIPPLPPPTVTCVVEFTRYEVGRRILSLIRPDGSEIRELGDGEEPAWSADGGSLFFRRENWIWQSDPDGSGATPLPFTEGGREPAVSSDGRRLAFARLSERGDYDIWVITLDLLP